MTKDKKLKLATEIFEEYLENFTERSYCLNALYPVPDWIKEAGYHKAGHDWCVEHWGTKWDIHVQDSRILDGELYFAFDTPWGPPDDWLKKVGQDYPTLRFELKYYEPGLCFAGKIVMESGAVALEYEVTRKEPEYKDFLETELGIEIQDDDGYPVRPTDEKLALCVSVIDCQIGY